MLASTVHGTLKRKAMTDSPFLLAKDAQYGQVCMLPASQVIVCIQTNVFNDGTRHAIVIVEKGKWVYGEQISLRGDDILSVVEADFFQENKCVQRTGLDI